MSSPNKAKDKFTPIKFIGYCMALMPPEGFKLDYEDYVRFAKFNLCTEKHLLMKDSLWDKYTDEEILAEYYGNLFTKNKEECKRFESQILQGEDDFASWADSMIEKNQAELEKESEKLDDNVNFNPNSIGEL